MTATRHPVDVAGAVLTGGASRRMGRPKATVGVGGRPMARRVADALVAAGCLPVVAIGGDADVLGVLGLDVIADAHPGEGPLGAIVTALRWAGGRDVVVAACDLPWLTAEVVGALLVPDVASPVVPDVVMARSGRLEPLLARWSPSALAGLERAFAAGERAVHRAAQGMRVREVAVPSGAVRNVNRPGDILPPMDAGSTGGVREVGVDGLARELDDGARLVDVRETDEYEAGHVPGAVHVPLGDVPDRIDAFCGSGPVYVICRSGARSMRACEHLATVGVEAVNVAGGTMAWMMSGRDVVTGDLPGARPA